MDLDNAMNKLDKDSSMPCLAFDVVRDIYEDIGNTKKDILKNLQLKSNDNGSVDLGDIASALDDFFKKKFGL